MDDWLDADADAAPEDESLARRFETIGFRAGIDVGEEGTLQSGFNDGYHEGMAHGTGIGELQGAARMLLEMSVAVGLRDGSPEAARLRHLRDQLDAEAKRYLAASAPSASAGDAATDAADAAAADVEKYSREAAAERSTETCDDGGCDAADCCQKPRAQAVSPVDHGDCACGEKPDGDEHHLHEHSHTQSHEHTHEHAHEHTHEGRACCGQAPPARLAELRSELAAIMAALGLARDEQHSHDSRAVEVK